MWEFSIKTRSNFGMNENFEGKLKVILERELLMKVFPILFSILSKLTLKRLKIWIKVDK